MDDRLVLNNC